jgi:hypothetical protein
LKTFILAIYLSSRDFRFYFLKVIIEYQEAPVRTNKGILGARFAKAVDVLESNFSGYIAEKFFDGRLDLNWAGTEPACRH